MSELSSLHMNGVTDLANLLGDGRLAGKLKPAARQGNSAAVRAAKDFESVFLHKLLKEMKDTIHDGGMLGDGTGDQIKDIFWQYLAQDLARKGGMGLWKEIYHQAGLGGASPAAGSTEQLL